MNDNEWQVVKPKKSKPMRRSKPALTASGTSDKIYIEGEQSNIEEKKKNRTQHQHVFKYKQLLSKRQARFNSSHQEEGIQYPVRDTNLMHSMLEKSEYWKTVKQSIEDARGDRKVGRLICLGLGSLENSRDSRAQLALAILLKDNFLHGNHCTITDPAMTADDELISQEFGFQVITSDAVDVQEPEEGTCDLFYMPHCHFKHIGQILSRANEYNFKGFVMFGNTLSGYKIMLETGSFREAMLPPIIFRLVQEDALIERTCEPEKSECPRPRSFAFLSVTTIDILRLSSS